MGRSTDRGASPVEPVDKGPAGSASRTRRKTSKAVAKRKLTPPPPKMGEHKYASGEMKSAEPAGRAANLLYLKDIAKDPTAPAAARVAAIKTLEQLDGGAGSSGLSAMTRAEIAAEINWCCSQLGRKPLM